MKLKFFDLAKKLSKFSDHTQHHLGCVIVRGNKVVGMGFNQLKTHSRSPHKYKSIHAEFHAIIKSRYEDLTGCEAYIYRENKSGDLAMARSCSYCMDAFRVAGIRKIFFSSPTGYQMEKIA